MAGTNCPLEEGFTHPPASARPWVNWIWLNGNISSNGITADLEAMQRVGIGGVVVMEVDYDTPKGPVPFASPEWRGLFKHLCAEGKRLGLEVRMNNDAGYCGSGGPWITPELSMQKLVWTETALKGPGYRKLQLAQPGTIENFYRDIAVVAFPTLSDDAVRMADFKPKLTASTGASEQALRALLDADTNTSITLPQPNPDHPSFVQLEFPQPYTARELVLRMPLAGDQIVHGWLQASDDGTRFRNIREFDVIPSTQIFNFATTSARFFRVLFPTRNADVSDFVISELELSPRYRIEGIEAKGLFVRKISYPGPSQFPGRAKYPSLPAEAAIDPAQVVDVSGFMDRQGKLRWNVPAGLWTVLRIGHTSTGKKNHPAPEAGSGLECDKLSKAGAEAAFNGLMGKLVKDAETVAVGSVLSTHIDSWEVGSQNWTAAFETEFERRRGYPLRKLLPILTGRFVTNAEVSERFLWDFRQTVSELLVDNYAGHMRELANKHGLRLSIEAYDAPCDDLTYAGRPDEPMAEFWTWPGFEMAYTCTSISSAAHVYGKRIAAAEAFTAMDAEKWLGHPYSIKAFGDWAFSEGLNRFVIHRYALQPWTKPERRPGMAFGPFGIHYDRTETWWEESRAWTEYLARCQYLLQQGLFVADICYLAEEMSPRHWRNPDPWGVRGGYNFDACPAEVLLSGRMSVKNGRLTLPDGMSYRLLALPETETMTPELLARIKSLVKAGATIVGAPPVKSPSLAGYPQCDERVARLIKEIWGENRRETRSERRLGKGRVLWGWTPAEVLARDGICPDFTDETRAGDPGFNWTHRTLPGAEIYFVANRTLESRQAVCAFRVDGMPPELWYPDTGKIEGPAVYDQKDTLRLPLRLGPAGSVFVVFRKGSRVDQDRIVSVEKDGREISRTSLRLVPELQAGLDGTNNFTVAVWVKPEAGTTLPKEAVFGKSEYFDARNDALYPPLGHYVYHSPDHAGMGLSVGTNGVWVIECSADYWGAPLVCHTPLTNWTHLAVVYREGRPSLYLNGRLAREGLQSPFVVHCGVGVAQRRGSAPFTGDLGEFYHAHRCLSETEIEHLAASMPVPEDIEAFAPIDFTFAPDGSLQCDAREPGNYVAKTASGQRISISVAEVPKPIDLSSGWELSFPLGWGAPERVSLENLVSWSKHPDRAIRHFSGRAVYRKSFTVPSDFVPRDHRLLLDLGNVQIMARVRLNGQNLGVLWKPPFSMDVTSVVRSGENSLEIEVVNLWINRMIGDESLPEDSPRKPNGSLKEWPQWLLEGKPSPTGRYTFTTYRLWQRDDPLQDSGLLGPVRIVSSQRIMWPGSQPH